MKCFWMGHRMLGDVIGFCAAAHLYAMKMRQPVKVWFDPNRLDACQFFEGVIWTPLEELRAPIDCGGTPTPAEWPAMNGVKRFYRYMDPTLRPTKSFDVHFNRPRGAANDRSGEKLIGLITHSNTQGDIDDLTLAEMLAEARRLYPAHRIVSFGCLENAQLPPGVEDRRAVQGNIAEVIRFVEQLDLLITPHSGPAFIAAGWRVPMWVYRSREPFWDWALNYERYQVERWWPRKEDPFAVFDAIYRGGGWNGLGSGPGSLPEVNREFIALLNAIIQLSPAIESILDIGCGDWQLMRHVNLAGKLYLGIDVAPTVISANQQVFGGNGRQFQLLNACSQELPGADLIILKDVIQHLPRPYVEQLLQRISTRCRLALIVNDFTPANSDVPMQVGDWRPINVLAPPYNFSGTSLGVWNGKHVTLSYCSPETPGNQ